MHTWEWDISGLVVREDEQPDTIPIELLCSCTKLLFHVVAELPINPMTRGRYRISELASAFVILPEMHVEVFYPRKCPLTSYTVETKLHLAMKVSDVFSVRYIRRETETELMFEIRELTLGLISF